MDSDFEEIGRLERRWLVVIGAAHKVAAFFADQLAVVLSEALTANRAVKHRVVVGLFRLLEAIFGWFGLFHSIKSRLIC